MKKKVLIVDDDEIIVETLSQKLILEGFDIMFVNDAYQALDLIIKNINFDLIIMDLMLPKLSGLKLMTILNRHYPKIVPVIFISSMNKSEIILAAIEKGAKDFLIKPVNFEELMIRINLVLTETDHAMDG